MRLRRLYTLIMASTLCACSHWPAPGKGGFAEHSAQPLYPSEPSFKNKEEVIASHRTIRIDAEVARNHLDTLMLAGASRCFPASVHTLKLRQARIERELAGGLAADAAIHLITQRNELAVLRDQVRLANSTYDCAVDQNDLATSHFQLHKAQQLLNSDNQFAVDSPALNPKYSQNIRKALALLTPFDHIQFLITGHTDSQGTDARNWPLANERAKNVAHYLMEQGVNFDAITLHAKATTEPLSLQPGDEHLLVNRRVTIQIIYGQKFLTQPNAPLISQGEI